MRMLLFTGKGGVGKTTLAAATAVRLAEQGRKVLVVSTDPAHSLADALDVTLDGQPREVASEGDKPGPFAAEVHVRALVDESWNELREHLRTVLHGAGVGEIDAEELTVLPGIEDLLALDEVRRLTTDGVWDTTIVDCGPTAETLRLLALPESFSAYLERLFPVHRRSVRGLLAGMAGSENVERWDSAAEALGRLADRLAALRDMLLDEGTSVRLVLSPETVVAAETRRTVTALALQRIAVDGLVANRIVPDPGSARGAAASWMRTRRREQEAVLESVRALTEVPLYSVEHRAVEPIGVSALSELGGELYAAGDPLDGGEPVPPMWVEGGGRALDSEYTLRIAMPVHDEAKVDLSRVGDDLALTIDGRRRLIALPAVLRRCVVTAALAGDDGLAISFRPDPDLWMR